MVGGRIGNSNGFPRKPAAFVRMTVMLLKPGNGNGNGNGTVAGGGDGGASGQGSSTTTTVSSTTTSSSTTSPYHATAMRLDASFRGTITRASLKPGCVGLSRLLAIAPAVTPAPGAPGAPAGECKRVGCPGCADCLPSAQSAVSASNASTALVSAGLGECRVVSFWESRDSAELAFEDVGYYAGGKLQMREFARFDQTRSELYNLVQIWPAPPPTEAPTEEVEQHGEHGEGAVPMLQVVRTAHVLALLVSSWWNH